MKWLMHTLYSLGDNKYGMYCPVSKTGTLISIHSAADNFNAEPCRVCFTGGDYAQGIAESWDVMMAKEVSDVEPRDSLLGK